MLGNTKTRGYHIWLPSGILINAKIRWAKIFTENAAKENHCKCLRALKKPTWDILRYLHIWIYEGFTLVNQVMRNLQGPEANKHEVGEGRDRFRILCDL